MNHKAHEMTVLKAGGAKPPALPVEELETLARTLVTYANAYSDYAVKSDGPEHRHAADICNRLDEAASHLRGLANYWGPYQEPPWDKDPA